MNQEMILYYKNRAKEYEKVYAKPERQNDLIQITHVLQNTFCNKNVFEIACGTGYWTERIAKSAKTILAADINESVIEVAKTKVYFPGQVTFQIADIFNLPDDIRAENLFGGFFWHTKLRDLHTLLKS